MDVGESREENTLRMWLNSLGLRDAKVKSIMCVYVYTIFIVR